jgi:hypothetical protein
MSRTPYETLTALDPNSIEQSVASAVAEYALKVMEKNRDKGVKLALLAHRLRENAHGIESGKKQTSPEMSLLLNAARPRDDDDNRILFRVRRLAYDIANRVE